MPTYNNALTDQPANRLAFPSSIGPVPRNEYLGTLADFLAKSYSPERTQQMQGISQLLGMPAVSRTLDMMSYGDPLTTGAGGLGGTTRVKPDVLEAAMTVAPLGKPATMATLQAARLARQAAMAGGRAGERYAEKVVPQIMERGGLGAEMLQGMSNRTISPLDVYHGSPHRLPLTERNPLGEFDASKIGTGEGAQVYGHGIYTAEARPVAEEYKRQLSADGFLVGDKVFDPESLQHMNVKAIARKGDVDAAIAKAEELAISGSPVSGMAAQDLERLREIKAAGGMQKNEGFLYKVDLPDEKIAKMLDWDKPLSQQSPEVQAALKGIEAKFPEIPDFNLRKWMDTDPLASTFHNVLNRDLGVGPAIIASTLKERGIPGVKYLDQQSRNAGGWHLTSPDNTVRGKWMLKSSDYNSNGVFFDSKKEAEAALKEKLGKETRNFVTFPGEEKNLTILERNGQKATRINNLAPQQAALDLAQQRAALPVEQGGLGLAAGNTADQRAVAQYGKDMVHFSRVGGDYTTLDSGKFAIAPFDAVGTHVGTPQAAMERFQNTVGYKVNNPNYANDELTGATYPVTILGNKPLMNQNGMPFGENDLNAFLRQQGGHNYSDIHGGKMTYQDMNADLRKKLFEEQGYTSIPYYNEVEGKGSISYIVPPENIRSRFAAFDPFRRSAAIAATMGVAAPDLLAAEDDKVGVNKMRKLKANQ